jgi:hypothetical protein
MWSLVHLGMPDLNAEFRKLKAEQEAAEAWLRALPESIPPNLGHAYKMGLSRMETNMQLRRNNLSGLKVKNQGAFRKVLEIF